MNDFRNIPCDSEIRDTGRLAPEEPYDGGGWPGDGSGTDDLADYSQNEAADYQGGDETSVFPEMF